MKHHADQFELPGLTDAFNLAGEKLPQFDEKARTFALSQGYRPETADSFARWIVDYCPEIQSYSNLFDYYMDKIAK